MKMKTVKRLLTTLMLLATVTIIISCPVDWQFQPDDSDFVWVFSSGTDRLVKIDPESGEYVINMGGFEDIVSMSVDFEDSQLWILDAGQKKLYRLSRDGEIEKIIAGFTDPRWVVYSYYDDTVWVADGLGGRVVHLSSEGDIIARYDGFTEVRHLDVDKARGYVWIADYSGTLTCITSGGDELVSFEVTTPISPVVETDTGSCWVVEYETGNLFLYQLNGEVLEFDLNNPVCERPVMMSYDEPSQYIWLAEEDGNLHLVRTDASIEYTVSDFGTISCIGAVYNGLTCWVTDPTNNQLVHIGTTGDTLMTMGGFADPQALAIVNRYTQ